ncbi:MAG: TetR/AcrR family transcriptional regulator [Pasteurellaceae bacterium]|nr:TetR/AcrR family transcriptional regulator [Pasteurellaceae bacterium]
MRQPNQDMAEQIFAATERLMARDGLPQLSMHKIAKETAISAGTIYLYFKSKEELLEQFALRVFSNFQQQLENNVDYSLSFFEQYRQMWLNIWQYLLDNPMIVSNMHQYQALPNFFNICKKWDQQGYWAIFCHKAQEAGILCNLPSRVLFSLGIESAMNLAHKELFLQDIVDNDILEEVIERTWRAIQK